MDPTVWPCIIDNYFVNQIYFSYLTRIGHGLLGYCSLYICHVIARNASYPYLHFVEKNNAMDNVAINYIFVWEYDNIYFLKYFFYKNILK